LPSVWSCLAVAFSSQLHNINSFQQSVYVHAVLGGGGPRWQPLNGADRHAPWRDASWRGSWQAATAAAADSCNRMAGALILRLESGWRWQRWSGASFGMMDSKFCFVFVFIVFGPLIVLSINIRPYIRYKFCSNWPVKISYYLKFSCFSQASCSRSSFELSL
jgi:hypothetical protein